LTKPFQSIRRLLEKVGLLAEGAPPEEMIQTAEYPKVEQPEPPTLSAGEIELTTADTRPLTPDLALSAPLSNEPQPQSAATSTTDDAKREPKFTEVASQPQRTAMNDELLDLGYLQQTSTGSTEEFVLDIDLDLVPDSPSVDRYPAYVGRADLRTTVGDLRTASFPIREATATVAPREEPAVSEFSDWSVNQFAETQEVQPELVEPATEPIPPSSVASSQLTSTSPSGMITLAQLSPEVIDAIARRAVEQLSEKAVQEIAWEVVPQLAELLIKRQLEEKSS
jgi:hypothetical protein